VRGFSGVTPSLISTIKKQRLSNLYGFEDVDFWGVTPRSLVDTSVSEELTASFFMVFYPDNKQWVPFCKVTG
jgi:hypothetical protein